MSDDKRQATSDAGWDQKGWTIDTLRSTFAASLEELRRSFEQLLGETNKRIEGRFDANEKAVNAALASVERALSAALAAQEKFGAAQLAATQMAVAKAEEINREYKATANEWRGAMTDRERTFIQRTEHDQAITNLEKTMNEIREQVRRCATFEATDRRFDALMVGTATLTRRLDTIDGRSTGMGQSWIILVAAVGLIATILGMYIALRAP